MHHRARRSRDQPRIWLSLPRGLLGGSGGRAEPRARALAEALGGAARGVLRPLGGRQQAEHQADHAEARTITHHPAWVAAAKLGPIAPDSVPPAIAPITATPSVIPTDRLVDAIAAATPACEPGIPDTAVFVIGGLTIPEPIPNRK